MFLTVCTDARGMQFENYIEEWETDGISLKNCTYICTSIFTMRARFALDAVRSTTSHRVNYHVVIQFVEMLFAEDLINDDQENVNYHLNAWLYQFIKAAKDIFKQTVQS
jgi:hypothetical protein